MIMSFHDIIILLWLHAASKTLNLEQVCYLIPLVCRSRYFMVSLSPFLTYEGKHSRTWNILLFQVPYGAPE